MPPVYQPSSRRRASCASTTPAPEKPGGMAIGPGYVAMPPMSAAVRPAASIAAMHASSVRSSGSRNSRRPISDWPAPLITAPCSITYMPSLRASGGGLEQRDVHGLVAVGVRLEDHLHGH